MKSLPLWKLVPEQLDEDMTEAMRRIEDGPSRTYQEVWDAILAAVPGRFPPTYEGRAAERAYFASLASQEAGYEASKTPQT